MGPIDGLKAAYEVAKGINNLDLQRQLIDVQAQILELQRENAELKEKLRLRDDFVALKKEMVFELNCYWRRAGEKKEGPFCSSCLDSKHTPIHMHILENGYARCPSCETGANLEPGRATQRQPRQDFDPFD